MMVTSYPVQRASYPVVYKERHNILPVYIDICICIHIYTLILHTYVYLPDSDPHVHHNSENFQFIASVFTQ